jgi:hypothetical protein
MTKYNFEPQKVNLHRKRFMSFREFMASGEHLRFKNKDKYAMSNAKPLRETIGNFQNDISETMFAAIPSDAIDRDRLITLLGIKLRQMSANLDIVVTVLGFEPAQNGD